jgi:hypothetical protein
MCWNRYLSRECREGPGAWSTVPPGYRSPLDSPRHTQLEPAPASRFVKTIRKAALRTRHFFLDLVSKICFNGSDSSKFIFIHKNIPVTYVTPLKSNVSDPNPDWIGFGFNQVSGFGIRIRIQEGKNYSQNLKK